MAKGRRFIAWRKRATIAVILLVESRLTTPWNVGSKRS
jgi:hypothetical protein